MMHTPVAYYVETLDRTNGYWTPSTPHEVHQPICTTNHHFLWFRWQTCVMESSVKAIKAARSLAHREAVSVIGVNTRIIEVTRSGFSLVVWQKGEWL